MPSLRPRGAWLPALLLASALPALAASPKGKPAPKPPPKDPPKAEVTLADVEPGARDPARLAAEQLLKALSKQGGEEGLGVLLGGATLVSRLYAVDNWAIVAREKRKVEVGDLASAKGLLATFDRERRRAHKELTAAPAAKASRNEVALSGVSAVDDAWTFELARDAAKELEARHPVFAFLAGADRQELGSGQDPFRKLVARAGKGGTYRLELDQLWVETREGRHEDKVARRWPIWVLRMKTKKLDSGVKVLPTSDTTGANAAEVCR